MCISIESEKIFPKGFKASNLTKGAWTNPPPSRLALKTHCCPHRKSNGSKFAQQATATYSLPREAIHHPCSELTRAQGRRTAGRANVFLLGKGFDVFKGIPWWKSRSHRCIIHFRGYFDTLHPARYQRMCRRRNVVLILTEQIGSSVTSKCAVFEMVDWNRHYVLFLVHS